MTCHTKGCGKPVTHVVAEGNVLLPLCPWCATTAKDQGYEPRRVGTK